MTAVGGMAGGAVTIRRVGIDDHSSVRYLHIKSMAAQSVDALSDAEMAGFAAFVRSPAYSECLLAEDVYGALVDGQLVGTASWHVNGDDGRTARISSVFVDPLFGRLGIGRRLLGEVEARAVQSGFGQFGISATINAVSFFEKLGYREASRGIKTFGPECSLPVAFLRKILPHLARTARAPAA
jgi:GNAT superfamily N-acetyltransferase